MSSHTFHVLFVCSGNSCRSPMAEGILKAKIPADLKEFVKVQSAGTLNLYGNPATHFAVEVAREFGANITDHRSQGLTPHLVRQADIIFAMAPEHRTFLESQYPEVRENVFLLKSFARKPNEAFEERIEDPIGGSREVYRECGEIINQELERILPHLRQLIEEKIRTA